MIPLDDDRVRRAETVFSAVADLPAEHHAAELSRLCGSDLQLRALVERLLRHDRQTPDGPLRVPLISAEPRRPVRVGHYRILTKIGEGGMGVVYEAEQHHPRRTVALKLIRSALPSRELLRRFKLEAEVLGQLRHPGIAQVYEAGTGEVVDDSGARGELPFVAMELVRGLPLNEYVRSAAPPLAARLELATRICDAVSHAHQRGVIHRDLKPANILVTEEVAECPADSSHAPGRGSALSVASSLRRAVAAPKIVDFGVARATAADVATVSVQTQSGQLMGTVPYMSPEQVSGRVEQVDVRSDVYALGVIIYQLLSGGLPYALADLPIPAAARVICEQPPRPAGSFNRALRGDVEIILNTALEKDPDRRYASVAALADDIRRHLRHEPIAARPASAVYQLHRFARRHTALVAGVLTTFVALLLGVIGTGYGMLKAQDALAREARQRVEAEQVAGFTEEVLGSASPFVALGRDTRLLKDMLDAAVRRIAGGELAGAPEAELRLRLTIGNTLRELSYFDDAAAVLEPAIDLADRTDQSDHPDKAAALGYLGWLRLDSGDAAAALALFEDALAMRQRLCPGDHSDVVTSIARVGSALEKLGRYAEALARFQEALAMSRRLFAGDHQQTADVLTNVAQCLQLNSRLDEALHVQEQALAMYHNLYRGDHPLIAIALGNQAGCLRALGRANEALPKFQESLAMRRRLTPDDDPRVANTINNVAACLRDLGRASEALPLHEEALEMYRRVFPEDHPEVAKALNSLGVCHFNLGNGEQALENYQRALEIRQSIHTSDHPDVAISLANVGSALMVLKRYDESRAQHEAALAMNRRLYQGDHVSIGIGLHNLADCIDQSGHPQDALPLFEEALAIRQRLYPADHTEIIQGKRRLGEVFVRLQRFAEAEPLLTDAADRLLARSYAPPRLKKLVRDALLSLYTAWHAADPTGGYEQKAATWQARFAPPPPTSTGSQNP
ncbi:MAG: Serine/threonine-protein kinase PknD [Phycisphaerae bacterium]|nr:Serine/threonine-protein kinase PknD [Phycisphaerae bacterium]